MKQKLKTAFAGAAVLASGLMVVAASCTTVGKDSLEFSLPLNIGGAELYRTDFFGMTNFLVLDWHLGSFTPGQLMLSWGEKSVDITKSSSKSGDYSMLEFSFDDYKLKHLDGRTMEKSTFP